MRYTIILALALILCIFNAVGYLTTDTFDGNTIPANITQNKSYSLKLTTNVTIVSANLTIKGMRGGSKVDYNVSDNTPDGEYATGWSGTYPYTNILDQNIGTWAAGNPQGNYYVNLTKPDWPIAAAYVKFKTRAGVTDYSYSGVVPANCINNNLSSIQFRFYQHATDVNCQLRCNDRTVQWAIMFDLGCNYITDASIYIGKADHPRNAIVRVGSTTVFYNVGNFTTENVTDLDVSKTLENCYDSGDNCSITVGASSFGLINLSALNVVYAGNMYFYVYDEQNFTLLNTTFKAEIIGDEYAQNLTILNGIGNVTGLQDGEYEIRFWDTLYDIRSYFKKIINAETEYVDLFALDKVISDETSFVVSDETGNTLEGALVKLQRGYIIDTTQVFKSVEMDKSNFNGIAVFSTDPDAKYKIVVEYLNETCFSSQEDYRLTDPSYSLVCSILEDNTQVFFDLRGVYSAMNITADNSTIFFTLNDPSSEVTEFCLEVDIGKALLPSGELEICDTCITGSSGTINCNISSYSSQEAEFTAKGKVTTGSGYVEFVQLFTIRLNESDRSSLGILGVFAAALIVLILFFCGLIVGGLHGSIIAFDLGFMSVKIMGLIDLSWYILMGIIVVSIIVAWAVDR